MQRRRKGRGSPRAERRPPTLSTTGLPHPTRYDWKALIDLSPDHAPIVLTECDGVAAALSADDAGALHLRVHVTGRWGKDTDAASRELRGVLERIVGSDLGRVLGLREGDRTLAKIEVRATGEAIDAELTGDGSRVADGLRSLLADAAPGW